MKVYKYSIWFYVFCLLLVSCCILVSIYLSDAIYIKVYACLLVLATLFTIIDTFFTEYIITESTIAVKKNLWGKKTEINFSDITHIFRTYPKDKIFLTILIMSKDTKIGILRFISQYKELLHTVLIRTKEENPNASIDILVKWLETG